MRFEYSLIYLSRKHTQTSYLLKKWLKIYFVNNYSFSYAQLYCDEYCDFSYCGLWQWTIKSKWLCSEFSVTEYIHIIPRPCYSVSKFERDKLMFTALDDFYLRTFLTEFRNKEVVFEFSIPDIGTLSDVMWRGKKKISSKGLV